MVPFLLFTGDADGIAPVSMSADAYAAVPASSSLSRGLVDVVAEIHNEPTLFSYNPLEARFVAAWFKIFVDGMEEETAIDYKGEAVKIDYESIIFGHGGDSVCGGGDGVVNPDVCEIVRGAR